MKLSALDLGIVVGYLLVTLIFGFWISRRASSSMKAYFLGGNTIPWYYLGLSNASGMFDVAGTMWTVTILFVYVLKSAWIPWLWPVWNQVFVFVFLALWLRRSGVLTGAQWIGFRFGDGPGARLSHIVVTIFAIISVFGFIAYFFAGIGKFAAIFFPWDLSAQLGPLAITSEQGYALIIIGITTLYTIKGGMWSVVGTEVLQFAIMTISCLVIGYLAYTATSAEAIRQAVPPGWERLDFGWKLNLDWTGYLDTVNGKIADDGFELFGLLLGMMVFKGLFASLAGPVPSYDMQRILSTRTPGEAARMSALTILVLYIPRYLMVAGFAVLALVYLKPEMALMGKAIDFEQVLPLAIERFVPDGWRGLLLAGLLAAFMGTFAAFINAAPAYLVNDLYRKYIRPNAPEQTYVRYSVFASIGLVAVGLLFGFLGNSLNALTIWITSALYGGYAAANMLKWIWWRFNGYGYFWGMAAGLIGSTFLPILFPDTPAIYLFPLLLTFSLGGCFLGVLMYPPEQKGVLDHFYRTTRPWGFWKPVRERVCLADPAFVPNRSLGKDGANVLVGIVWQMSQVVLPMYFMIRHTQGTLISLALFVVSSYLLKRNWLDRLAEEEDLKANAC